MSAILLSLLFLSRASPVTAAGGAIALRSLRIAPYDEALRGFASLVELEEDLVLSELAGREAAAEVLSRRPGLILAMGLDALAAVRDVEGIPVVYLMVPDPGVVAGNRRDITGVSLDLPAEKQLAAMRSLRPGAKRVGIVHDPLKTGYLVSRARAPAEKLGLELVVEAAGASRDLPGRLEKFRGAVDFLWMLPDVTVYSPEAIEYLLHFSLESRIPIFSFSRKYVALGALASLDIDPYAAGRQAGEMARLILAGADARAIPRHDPRDVIMHVNLSVARRLGIVLDDAVLKSSRTVPGARP